jgi:hypothetical protein
MRTEDKVRLAELNEEVELIQKDMKRVKARIKRFAKEEDIVKELELDLMDLQENLQEILDLKLEILDKV